MQLEKVGRMSPREEILGYRIGTELSVEASFDGARNSAGRLVQVSLEHLRLQLSSAASPKPGQTASVRLDLGGRWTAPLLAEVTDVQDHGQEQSELGMRILNPSLDAGRRIASVLEYLRDTGKLVTPEARPVWKERITSADRILRIWDALVARRCRGVARAQDGRRVEVNAAYLDKYGQRIGWEFHGEVPRGPFSLEAFGYSSVLTFDVEQVEEAGGYILVPLPESMVRFRHRWLRRSPVSSECWLRFTHPLWPQVHVVRPVLDISYEGLSCYTEPGEDLLYPGMQLPEILVEMPGRAPVKLRAELRNLSSTPKGRRCGMYVTPADEQVREWRALVEEQMHPNTEVAGDWNEPTWELFDRSGYFRLSGKVPEKFAFLKAQFHDTQSRLGSDTSLGYRVVRPAPTGGVEATLSVLKPYTHSWLAHQLARHDPGAASGKKTSAREALRDIYLRGYEPVQIDPNVKWLFAYAEAHVRWTRFTKFDFAKWYEHTGQSALIPFRLMEGEVNAPWPAIPEGLSVSEATAEECTLLLEKIERTRPMAYREVMDLVPERFDLKEVKQAWESARLSREREVVVARRDGRPIAAAILETAHPGLNLFNILDGVRVVSFEDEDMSDEVQDAYVGLLSTAAEWFRARGRAVFVHYMESEHPAYAERAALADLGEGLIWIISARLLPEFIENLCEATTPRANN